MFHIVEIAQSQIDKNTPTKHVQRKHYVQLTVSDSLLENVHDLDAESIVRETNNTEVKISLEGSRMFIQR